MLYCRQRKIRTIHYTNKFQQLRFVQLSPDSMTEVLLFIQADLYCNLSSTDRTPIIVRHMLQRVFFVTNYQYSFDCALCFMLNLQKYGIKYCKFKAEKTKAKPWLFKDVLLDMHILPNHFEMGRDCFASSLQFVGFYLQCSGGLGPSAEKERATEKIAEYSKYPRAKVHFFLNFSPG